MLSFNYYFFTFFCASSLHVNLVFIHFLRFTLCVFHSIELLERYALYLCLEFINDMISFYNNKKKICKYLLFFLGADLQLYMIIVGSKWLNKLPLPHMWKNHFIYIYISQ
jgi:hypothetical protein